MQGSQASRPIYCIATKPFLNVSIARNRKYYCDIKDMGGSVKSEKDVEAL